MLSSENLISFLSLLGLGVEIYSLYVKFSKRRHLQQQTKIRHAAEEQNDLLLNTGGNTVATTTAEASKSTPRSYHGNILSDEFGILPYDHPLNLPNEVFGAAFFAVLLFTPWLPVMLVRIISLMALSFSIYLWYKTKDVLEGLSAILQMAIYICNAFILIVAFFFLKSSEHHHSHDDGSGDSGDSHD